MMFSQQVLSAPEALILSFSAILAGIFVLVKGGGWTIDSAVYVARKLKISTLLIGFTIVAFGTSLPELVVSVNANIKGFPGLSIGNVVGSNIANILFVVGLTAIIAPLYFERSKQSMADSVMLLLSSTLLVYLVMQDVITSFMGSLMFLSLAAYVVWQYNLARTEKKKIKKKEKKTKKEDSQGDISFSSMPLAVLFLLMGLAGIALGAEILVRGAVLGAKTLGVPELVIGLTIVALGTSLPELVTCIIAVKKNQSSLVIGNVVGSGVFNILSIVGLTALITPIEVHSISDRLLTVDIWIMLFTTLLFIGYLVTFKRFGRAEGLFMFLCYCIFNIEQYFSSLT